MKTVKNAEILLMQVRYLERSAVDFKLRIMKHGV